MSAFQRQGQGEEAAEFEPHDTLVDEDSPSGCVRRGADRTGDILGGRFLLDIRIGAGSAGAVYAATDLFSGKPVAVKLLHQQLVRSPEHLARFRREARLAAQLEHPGIVKVFDVRREGDGTTYMVMELLRGEVMHAAMFRGMGASEALGIGLEVLDALDAAHREGVVHRDVKPENIFLARQPDGSVRVKLLDFGIACFLRPGTGDTFRSVEGFVVGTPHYMSPEACVGEGSTPAMDLWAVGAVLFHAFTGAPPFDHPALGELLRRIAHEPAPSLGARRPDLPGWVIAVIDRALDPDPTRRFSTARDFRDALAGVG